MKTTIDIADALFRAAKREAQRRGTTLKEVKAPLQGRGRGGRHRRGGLGADPRRQLRGQGRRGDLLGESVADVYWLRLKEMLSVGCVSGPLVHDARIAAICLAHGIGTLWTTDCDFSRFPELPSLNPLA